MAEGPEHNVAPLPREHDEGARPGTRSDYESVDFEVVEELGIDVEFEDASVQKILAMTGEDWSLDEQRETLKEAAKNRRAKAGDDEPSSRPSLHIPTPYDLGGSSPGQRGPTSGAAARSGEEARPAIPRMATRAVPRPLASTPPSGPPKPRSVPPPPLPPNRGSAQPPARGSVKPSPPQAPLPSRRPPPLPKAENATGSKVPPAPPPTVDVPRTTPEGHALVELLTARIDRLAEMGDRVGLARARLELSIVHETLGDDARVNAELEAALDADPDLGPAHAGLRRRVQSSSADPTSYRTQASTMLRHLERELAGASGDTAIVELLVERARLLGASDRPEEAHAAWELVLGRSPHHAAALKGFESALSRSVFVRAPGKDAFIPTTDDERWENLVAHLGRMADSYSAQPNLAAWLHVERARILEFYLGRVDAARGALERALRLDGSVGPVRDAFTLHCAAHHDSARLAALFAEEARLETTPARCAELELDAATLAHSVLDDDATAVALLESAAARAPTTPSVDRRVLDDLVRLYEVSGQWPEAARTRRNRLRFFTDVSAQTYELVRLSAIEEKLGNLDNATADVLRALELDPGDATLVDEVDRLLAASGKDDERIALWHREAQRAEEGPKRARALAKAAHLAERRGQLDEAIRHLRAAWVAAPGDSEILDALSRLMSPTPTEGFDREVRALIELYSQAAQATPDTGRRVAYLEKVATLWEELVGDPVRAARTFEEILRLEPDRRVAVLGLERTAARIGDDRALSRALEAEARLAEDGVDVLALRVRAAQTLARVDPLRATHLVHEVLELDPEHMGGRNLETRLHAEAGRWELAAQSIRARLGIAVTTKDKVALWLELAQIYDARLRDPKAAVEALEEARKVDPSHPVPPEEIARVLEAAGDAKALRIALERLARDAITPEERARHLTLAAEIDELRLQDISSAAALYRRALAETPDDGFIADRLVRVLARHAAMSEKPGRACLYTAAFDEFLAELGKRAEKAKSSGRAHACSFQLASLLVTTNRDLYRARALLDAIHETDPRHTGALRLLEYVARRDSNPQKVAHAVKQQADRFDDVRARLGALWELASLEAWVLPGGEAVGTYTRILELDPTDASALAAAVRLALLPSRHGEAPARRAAIAALRALSALAHDEATRIATDLRLALILETHAMDPATERETSTSAAREALERLRAALALDPLSVTAATTLARLANRLDDASGAAAAALSLAELSVQPKVRAKYLIDAANLLLGDSSEEALGPMEERTERAAALLEKALEADPDSTAAATRLSQVRTSQQQGERLIDVFRGVLARATAKDTRIFAGTEIARVARDDLDDVGVAIEAMRAVRSAAPDHVPSLLTLSELFIAQRAWPEATETLEAIANQSAETPPRLTALFALSSIYDQVLGEPASAERALRTALSIDPDNARAIRALIHHLAARQNEVSANGRMGQNSGEWAHADAAPPSVAAGVNRTAAKLEIASLLDRLAHVETDPNVKCDILLELADVRIVLKDQAQAERTLVEALAIVPRHPRAFARLSRLFRSPKNPGPGGLDAVSYARALNAVIVRGQQLGTSDPRWYATLGHVEIEQLNRLRDGIGHLQQAVQMDPTLHECRYEAANALARLGAYDEASKVLVGMLTPNATPLVSIADPAGALALLERSFGAERRQEEAIVISELRAIAGELDEGRHAWLRARRLLPFEQHHSVLDRTTLVNHVVPPEGRHVLLEVAGAIAGIETKLLRADLGEIGVSSRDRIGRRSGHPTRALLDRLARALGIGDVELVLTPNVSRTRVLAHDGLWVVVPRSLVDLPEPTQLASLGRALARIALNVPWLEELPPPHIEAMLIAAARVVNPSYAKDEIDVAALKLVMQYEPTIAKELSRKQRQALEKLVPAMNAGIQGSLPATSRHRIGIDVLIGALARAELRIAYVLTGDVLATIDELRGLDAAFRQATATPGRATVQAVLNHPFSGDVIRFALTAEATALRRRAGSTWAA